LCRGSPFPAGVTTRNFMSLKANFISLFSLFVLISLRLVSRSPQFSYSNSSSSFCPLVRRPPNGCRCFKGPCCKDTSPHLPRISQSPSPRPRPLLTGTRCAGFLHLDILRRRSGLFISKANPPSCPPLPSLVRAFRQDDWCRRNTSPGRVTSP